MRLSEAIRFGSMMSPQAFGGGSIGDGRCALAAACEAVGLDYHESGSSVSAFPILDTYISCPSCGCRDSRLGYVIAQHLNDNHRWTRERIADWVATIEATESASTVESTREIPEPVL